MAETNQNGSLLEDPILADFFQKLRELIRSNRVYINPPSGFRMKYDCIVIEEAPFDVGHADNIPYRVNYRFTMTYITKAPYSTIPRRLLEFPWCSQDRKFVTDNLHHYVFTIYL